MSCADVPGYYLANGFSDADTDIPAKYKEAVDSKYCVGVHVKATWEDLEEPESDFSMLRKLIGNTHSFCERHGLHICFEVENQRYGSRDVTARAKLPRWVRQQTPDRFAADDRGPPFNHNGGMYFTGKTAKDGGKWLERLWGDEMDEYLKCRVRLYVEAYKALEAFDAGWMLTHVLVTSETAKQNHTTQSSYTHEAFLAAQVKLARWVREGLDAEGGQHVAVLMGMNFWPSGWNKGHMAERVFDPICKQGERIGLSIRDVRVTYRPGYGRDSKKELEDYCAANHATVPFEGVADWSFWTSKDSLTGKDTTLVDYAHCNNGDLGDMEPKYYQEPGFTRTPNNPGMYHHYVTPAQHGQYLKALREAMDNVPLYHQVNTPPVEPPVEPPKEPKVVTVTTVVSADGEPLIKTEGSMPLEQAKAQFGALKDIE